jgi:glycosidase
MKTTIPFLFALTISISSFAQTVKPKVPEWVHNAVFYEIYPQTFYDTDADGTGDLKGIIQKLDYVKGLGVNAIWLNPFYESPFRDAGYDVSDYYKVSARYGNLDDAKNLFAEAHKRGLKVIIDFVPGHTSMDHPWFKESAKLEKNKYSNWYIWTNSTWNDGGKDKGRGSIGGFSERDGSFLINFFWHQPALNYGYAQPDPLQPWQLPVSHPDVQAMRHEMKNILKYWQSMGCDGFRVDMASVVRKDNNNEEGTKLWQEMKAALQEKDPDVFMVSEWSYPKFAVKAGFTADFMHWFEGYEDLFRKESWRSLNNVAGDGKSWFDKDGKGDISSFLKTYLEQYEATKGDGYISLPVGNHDLSRVNVKRSDDDLEIISAFLLAMPGVPFMYYGDEIGMKQLSVYSNKEGCYPPRGGSRTPMQWNAGANKGFSTGSADKLWQPVDPATDAPNVASQEVDLNSLLTKTKLLIHLKRTEKALAGYANFVPLYAEKNKYPFVFSREADGEKIVVALNPSGADVAVDIPVVFGKKTKLLAGRKVRFESNKTSTMLDMKGVSYAIFKVK